MALPTTISGTKFTVLVSSPIYSFGPFLSAGGNVYVVLLGSVDSKLHVYKATDPTSSFTEQDSSHIPAQAPANWASVKVLQNGDVLSIVGGAYSTTPAYKFHQFSMATDLWSATIKDKAIASPTTVQGYDTGIDIVKRSDASFVAFFNGAKEVLMGAGFERVFYSLSTDGGSTWGTPVAVDGLAGTKVSAYGAIVVLGASDRAHFFYLSGAGEKHRSLSSSNVLDTEAAIATPGASLVNNFGPGVAYVSGANTVVKVPAASTTSNKISNVYFNSGANPSITVETDISTTTVLNNAGTRQATCYALDGTTAHMLFSDATSFDLMHDLETDGGAWGTDVNEWAATINAVSANIYTRSGSKVLAVIVDDGGTIKYNEITLSVAVAGVPRFPMYLQARPRAASF